MGHVSFSESLSSLFHTDNPQLKNYRVFALYLSILTLGSLAFIAGSGGSESLYWPGWYILKLSPETDVSRADEYLQSAGIKDFISAENTEISYMAIPDMARIGISHLDEVLVPGDPRRDPYITRIQKLFDSAGSPLIYLPDEFTLRDYRQILKGIEGFENWQLMDDKGDSRILKILLIFSLAALSLAFTGRSGTFSIMRIVSILPFALFLYRGSSEMVFPLLLLFFLSPGNFRQNGSGRGRLYSYTVYTGFTVTLITTLAGLNPAEYIPFAAALLSSELIHFLPGGIKRFDDKVLPTLLAKESTKKRKEVFRKRSEHQLFTPLSLMQPVKRFSGFSMRNLATLLSLLFVFSTPFLPGLLSTVENHSPLPHALKAEVGFEDLTSLFALSERQNQSSLPDVSSMLSSAVFQGGFIWGAEYRLPLPGESLNITSYHDDGDRIAVSESDIETYNKSWYEKVLNRELDRGAGRLFASLGGPASVIEISRMPGIEEIPLNRIQISLYSVAVLVMLLLTFYPVRGNTPYRSIYKPIMTARRRAQAA